MPEEIMRPFVQVAAICHLPLQDTTGSLSLIRITDRIAIRGLTETMSPQPLFQLQMVVVLKSGPMRGKYKWNIVAETPSARRIPGPDMTALFEGDERGVALLSPVTLVAEEEGLYWFDVMLEGGLLTRIPLRVMYEQVQGMPFPPQVG